MTTSDTSIKMNKLRAQVLAGIAAGEVRRVDGRAVWYRPDGHVSRFGTVYTRWPTTTVNQLVEAGLVAYSSRRFPDLPMLTRAGKAALTNLMTRQ